MEASRAAAFAIAHGNRMIRDAFAEIAHAFACDPSLSADDSGAIMRAAPGAAKRIAMAAALYAISAGLEQHESDAPI